MHIALTLYEYLLTLSNEFALFWESKSISASSFLYLLLRIVLLAIAGTTIAGNYVPSSTDTVGISLNSTPPYSDARLAAYWVRASQWHITNEHVESLTSLTPGAKHTTSGMPR